MQILGTGLGAELRKAFRLDGSPPSLSLAPDLIPVCNALTLEDSPWHGKRGFSAFAPTGSAAAWYGYFTLGLDADAPEHARLVLRRVSFAASGITGGYLGIRNTNNTDGAEWDLVEWDQSVGGPKATTYLRAPVTAWIGVTQQAIPGGMTGELSPGGYAPVEIPGPFIIGPGQFLYFRHDNPNIASWVNVYGDIYL